jgi:hypothetical protein
MGFLRNIGYIVTCRPIARERVGKHVSMELDPWKPSRRCVINRCFFVHGNKRRFLSVQPDRVEAGSNTSTVALRVVGGDEKGTECLGM